jgi:hypothetical protein
LERRIPDLSFADEEYWQQFKPGSRYVFELRYGAFCFYQLNLAPIHADMRHFYRGDKPSSTSQNRR